MSDYSRVYDFSVKDALTTGDPAKVIKGSEVDEEFDALVTMSTTKIDEPATPSAGDVLTYSILGVWEASSNVATPPGTMSLYGGASAPNSSWLICDGSSVSTTTYADLFAIIGYTFGGSGASFNIPDMRGVFPIGVSGTYALAATGGTATETLSTSQIPSHNHSFSDSFTTNTTGNHSHSSLSKELSRGSTTGSTSYMQGTGTASSNVDVSTSTTGNHSHTGSVSGTTGTAGSGSSHNNLPPYLALNFIIKV